jgi:hypothetical protein
MFMKRKLRLHNGREVIGSVDDFEDIDFETIRYTISWLCSEKIRKDDIDQDFEYFDTSALFGALGIGLVLTVIILLAIAVILTPESKSTPMLTESSTTVQESETTVQESETAPASNTEPTPQAPLVKKIAHSCPALLKEPLPLLAIDAEGKAVYLVQKVLNHLRIAAPVKADGLFKKDTRLAVLRLQQQYGLKVDGMVGDETWTLIKHMFPC